MHGIVTAGSPATAAAGARMLELGGNAIDAVTAAVFATGAGEPTLTSLAGGGVLTFREAASGAVTAVDFFSNVPGLGLTGPVERDFFAVELDFGPTTQTFHIGRASAAVPGTLPGICEVHERWGRLPLAEVVGPVAEQLRDGVASTAFSGVAAGLLEPILAMSPVGRELFWRDGRLIGPGDVFANPSLATTLERMAEVGWRNYYQEELWPQMLALFGPSAGGLLTRADLEAFEVTYTPALQFDYRGARLSTPPPPAAGGVFIRLMLSVLETVKVGPENWDRAMACAMKIVDMARSPGAPPPSDLTHWRGQYGEVLDAPLGRTPSAPGGHSSTTHISVIDADGNAAGVTVSHGEGNAVFIGDTGIHMNNFMGEADLHPQGWFQAAPGTRLTTMMTPTVMEGADGSLTVLGSGGANRIRTAITQVVCELIDCQREPVAAVEAPRLHFEHGVLNAEGFDHPDGRGWLANLGAERLVIFPDRNMFFGGVHVARKMADGALVGAGDPRRSGTVEIR